MALALILVACTTTPAANDAATSGTDAARPATDTGTPPSDTSAPSPDAFTGVDAATTSPDAFTDVDAGATSIADVIDRATFDAMFLHRMETACNAALYDYDALVAAAARFPSFLAEGTLDDRRREAAAFLANASHETTGGWSTAPDGPYAWGLCFREEVGCGSGGCTGYCDPSS